LEGIARFIASDLGIHVPWHISRFFPRYRMTDRGITPVDTLTRAVQAGRRHALQHLYTGNCADGLENSDCPACGTPLLRRCGYQILDRDLHQGVCRKCGVAIAGVW
jgi:pyruvate formate lyase activating enzyme